jgi:hypothetical protein
VASTAFGCGSIGSALLVSEIDAAFLDTPVPPCAELRVLRLAMGDALVQIVAGA